MNDARARAEGRGDQAVEAASGLEQVERADGELADVEASQLAARDIPGLPLIVHAHVDELLVQPLRDPELLLGDIDSRVAAFERRAQQLGARALDAARQLAAALHALRASLRPEDEPLGLRLWQTAALYFLSIYDAGSDVEDGGLDDDIAVFNAIALFLGRDHGVVSVVQTT